MRFSKVEVEEEGIEAVMSALRGAEASIYGLRDFSVSVPVEVPLGDNMEHCVVPIGGDGEPVHLEVDLNPNGSRILFIGQVAAEPLGIDFLNRDDGDGYRAEVDKAFDEWSGGWAVFLKVEITPEEEEAGVVLMKGLGEMAVLESKAELDEYGADSGVRVFRDRLAQLSVPEEAPSHDKPSESHSL